MRSAIATLVALAVLFWLLVIWLPSAIGADSYLAGQSATVVSAKGEIREYGFGQIRFNGHGPEWHRWQKVLAERKAAKLDRKVAAQGRTIRRLQRVVATKVAPAYEHMIDVAAKAYGVDSVMLKRKARCESVNFTDFYNETPIYNGEHAQGVFGFIPSTFQSTPFAAFSIQDPLANIMAGAWMHARGRGGEWACR